MNFKEHIICKKNYISVFHNHPEHCPPQEPCVTGQVVYKVLKKCITLNLRTSVGFIQLQDIETIKTVNASFYSLKTAL